MGWGASAVQSNGDWAAGAVVQISGAGVPRRRLTVVRGDETMRVTAWPAYRNRKYQPYNELLYSAMERRGARVLEFGSWPGLTRACDVFHVHWPEYCISHPGFWGRLIRESVLYGHMKRVQAQGGVVIWTMHNSSPNFDVQFERAAKFYDRLLRSVDGLIFHNPYTAEALRDDLGVYVPSHRHAALIPYGHYGDVYPRDSESKCECRRALGFDSDRNLVLLFGHIRSYKNYELALSVAAQKPEMDFLIVGKPGESEYVDLLRDKASQLANVYIDPRLVPEKEVSRLFVAADVVCAPSLEPLNSGVAVLARTFGRPVVMRTGYGAEGMRYWYGKEAVVAVSREGGEREWAKALDDAASKALPADSLDEKFGWDSIAEATAGFYEKVLADRCGP